MRPSPRAKGSTSLPRALPSERKSTASTGLFRRGLRLCGGRLRGRPAHAPGLGDDGILHMHLTGVPDMICPFMDCHADYLLRGEHAGLAPDYARWHVSGYNLSNSIGTFCYDRLRVNPA